MTNLRALPSVNDLLQSEPLIELAETAGRDRVLNLVRTELDRLRTNPDSLSDDRTANRDAIAACVLNEANKEASTRLGRVINATGIILHTGLGRAPVSDAAMAAATDMATAGNVEVCLHTGDRRYRGHQLQPRLEHLTGCEDSLIVNNNAAATLLTLQALCEGREVIISRGQLIEIGGSFRLPEIFELGGAKLKEVGTTNRTRVQDYADAVGPNTAAIMHVHPSNYKVVGFSSTPTIEELVPVARKAGIIAIDDIGSGALVDVTKYGLPEEPTFTDSIAAGADVVLGSGDKLLGGPQAGIIIGRNKYIEPIRKAPFARTVRVDKLTLAALDATLDSYVRGKAEEELPTLQMLSADIETLKTRADGLVQSFAGKLEATVAEGTTPVGGGSLPGAEMPSVSVLVKSSSPNQFALQLRTGSPRVFPRVQDGCVVLDMRSIRETDLPELTEAVLAVASS
ncbi:MAG: L-seryl-tRNA(Sec) selenium transferase [Planctomycetaceae bacterium]